jgi:hypothetical protein
MHNGQERGVLAVSLGDVERSAEAHDDASRGGAQSVEHPQKQTFRPPSNKAWAEPTPVRVPGSLSRASAIAS